MIIFRHIIHLHYPFEEFSDWGFIEKRHAQDAKHIKSASIKPEVMLNNSNKAIGCNCREYLDSDSIFGYTPERLYVQMLFNPLKEQFYLPSVFIKQGNVFCADFKIVGEVSEGPLVFNRVIADTPEQNRVFSPCLLSCKSYRLIVENIIRAFKEILALNYSILKLTSFSYYKVGADEIDCKEPCKIKIATIKNIVSILLVRNFIHRIHVMNLGLRNMKKGWNLSNNIKKCMYLNTTFGLAKTCPPEKVKAQVNRSRIKSIKSSINFKLFGNSFTLGDEYHFVGKILKYLAIPIRVRFRQIAACYQRFTETQMVRLRSMCSNYADKLSKAITARQLTVHHDQQLVPATKRLDVFVTLVLHNDSLKCFLRKKLDKLCKNIFSTVHTPKFNFEFKGMNSNRGQPILSISCIISSF